MHRTVHPLPAPRYAAPRELRLRSGRLAEVHWRDLTTLSRYEVLREITLSWPWFALSLFLASEQLWLPALAASFMMFLTGLRQVHNAQHYALGLSPRATEWFLFAMSIVMLGSMHAVQFNHLRHHKLCMTKGDVEAASARKSGLGALLFGPVFPVLLHWTALRLGTRRTRLWITAELVANALWIVTAFAWWESDPLRYHLAAMGVAQCLTSFFAVWTVHHHTDGQLYPARTQRGRLANVLSYHMFLHLEHHLFPRVPTCHLPQLAKRLDANMPGLVEAQVLSPR